MDDLILRFAVPHNGSFFMTELADVLVDAVRRAGGQADLVVGRWPREPDELGRRVVPVVIAHEFLALADPPSAGELGGAVSLGVEHPGTATFEAAVTAAASTGAAVEINVASVAELDRRGIRAQHLPLGWSPLWDEWHGDPGPRPIDVTVLATHDRVRDARLARVLWELRDVRQHLVMAPDEVAIGHGGGRTAEVLVGEEKWRHLARSRVILNLHRGQSTAFEWVRALEAICNGAVVVTEPSEDLSPLVPGRHLLVADHESMADVVHEVLADPDRQEAVRSEAYQEARSRDCTAAGRVLLQVAADLAGRHARVSGPTRRSPEAVGERSAPHVWTPAAWLPGSRFDAPHRRVAGPAGLLAEVLDRAAQRGRVDVDEDVDERESAGVQILDVVGGHARLAALVVHTAPACLDAVVRSLEDGIVRPGRIVLARADPVLGAGVTRNLVASWIPRSADLLHVQDGSLLAAPDALARLVDELDHRPSAVVSYAAVAEPTGLAGTLDPAPHRLARHAYLNDGYVVRVAALAALGGYCASPWLDGLEDHDLWCRLVATGFVATRVPAVLFRREERASLPWPASEDPETARAELERRSPTVAAADPFPVRDEPWPFVHRPSVPSAAGWRPPSGATESA